MSGGATDGHGAELVEGATPVHGFNEDGDWVLPPGDIPFRLIVVRDALPGEDQAVTPFLGVKMTVDGKQYGCVWGPQQLAALGITIGEAP